MEYLKLKVSEFAKRYNITRQGVYKLSKEGKLLLSNGIIDEALPTNRVFVEARQMRFKEQTDSKATNTLFTKESALDSLTGLKKENLRLDAQFKQLRNDEKSGNLIAMDFAGKIINIYSHAIVFEFLNYLDNELINLAVGAGIDRIQMTDLRTKSKKLIIDSANTATDKAKKDLKIYVDNLTFEQ